VQLVEITRGTSTEQAFEVVLTNGMRVRVPMPCDGVALKELLAVLATC
jgi:hypothetical protein